MPVCSLRAAMIGTQLVACGLAPTLRGVIPQLEPEDVERFALVEPVSQ